MLPGTSGAGVMAGVVRNREMADSIFALRRGWSCCQLSRLPALPFANLPWHGAKVSHDPALRHRSTPDLLF